MGTKAQDILIFNRKKVGAWKSFVGEDEDDVARRPGGDSSNAPGDVDAQRGDAPRLARLRQLDPALIFLEV